MATEDFSFPRIGDTSPCSIDSPPLWNLSPAASPNPYQAFREGNREYGKEGFEAKLNSQAQRKGISFIETSPQRAGVDDEGDRMDSLWEDFNEELTSSTTMSSNSSSRETVELRCAPSLTVAKTGSNGAMLPTKNNKPGMVLIVKVLKKLFSLNNSQGKARKGKPRKRVR